MVATDMMCSIKMDGDAPVADPPGRNVHGGPGRDQVGLEEGPSGSG